MKNHFTKLILFTCALSLANFSLKYKKIRQETPPLMHCDEGIFFDAAISMYKTNTSPPHFVSPALNFYLPYWVINYVAEGKEFDSEQMQNKSLVYLRFLVHIFLYFFALFSIILGSYILFQKWVLSVFCGIYYFICPLINSTLHLYPDYYISHLAALFVLPMALLIKGGSHRRVGISISFGIILGLLVSLKWTALIFFLPLSFLYLLKGIENKRLSLKMKAQEIYSICIYLLNILMIACFSFFIINPEIFTRFGAYKWQFVLNIDHYKTGHAMLEAGINNYFLHGAYLFFVAFGLFGFLPLIGGGLFIKRQKSALLSGILFLPAFCIVLSFGSYRIFHIRNLNLSIPFLTIIAGSGLFYIYQYILPYSKKLAVGIICLFFLEPTGKLLYGFYKGYQEDSRQQAQAWISNNLPKEAIYIGFDNCGWRSPLAEAKYPYHASTATSFFTETFCANYIVLDSWSASPEKFFKSPFKSFFEWDFHQLPASNAGGGNQDALMNKEANKFLSNFDIIKKFNGYGPEVIIYKNKVACEKK